MKTINALIIVTALILVGCANDNYIIIPGTSNGGNGTTSTLTTSDGWIIINQTGNNTYNIGWNTTKPTTCSSGNYSYWNGTEFLCSPDMTSGGNYSDGNNYTTAISFTSSGNNVILDMSRVGMGNLSSFFTFSATNGILVNNGVFYPDAQNCSSGQYSRYESGAWNCYNDASGGSGTVTSVTINSTTPAISVTGSPITTSGVIVIDIANATVFNDGLMTASQATAINSKALAGNCIGYNSTHVNVTMNATTAGVQCVEVLWNTTSINTSLYVPYTGATGNVSLGSYTLLAHSIKPDGSDGLLIEAANSMDVASFGVGNTNNSLFYGSVSLFNGQNLCLGGVCRSTWPNETLLYQNVTDLQNSNTSTNNRINTINTTVQNLLSSNASTNTRVDTLNTSISTLSTFAQTKAATGYSTDCATGIAGFTINNGTAPNVTCAPAQSGGSGPFDATNNLTANIRLGNYRLYTSDSGTAYLSKSPSYSPRMYFNGGGEAIEWDNYQYILLANSINEFRTYSSDPAGLNITNTFTGTGNLWVEDTIYVPEICLNGDCKTAWPGGSAPPPVKFINVLAGAVTDTNQPAAARAFGGTYYIVISNLTEYTEFRFGAARAATAAAAGSVLWPKYRNGTCNTLTVGSWNDLESSGPTTLSMTTANQATATPYLTLANTAKDDVCLMFFTSGGDGALDPQFRNIWLEFK